MQRLQGFIGREKALKKGANKKVALAQMAELETAWLPVVERTSLVGVVERQSLAASLVLDIILALEARESK